MPRVLVYEFATSGGLVEAEHLESLAVEGKAMAMALATDLAMVPGVEAALLCDVRFNDVRPGGVTRLGVGPEYSDRKALAQSAARFDWTIVIAPENDGILAERAALVRTAGGRLLGCGPHSIQLASDKHDTAEALLRAGVPAPRGWLGGAERWPEAADFPVVLKPCDGCAATGVQLHYQPPTPAEIAALRGRWRLEAYHPGLPASVAVLCGPSWRMVLPSCAQRIELRMVGRHVEFSYQGGSLPLKDYLASRAHRLALSAVDCLSDPLGYVGVDLVLGADLDGRHDVVLEINPRLTTSYLGLRAACEGNLAAALVAIAEDRVCELRFREQPIDFSTDGTIRTAN